MHESECTRNCWIFGAIAGLVVMLFVSGIGDLPWIAGLFLGFVTFVLFGGLLIWLICEGRAGNYDVNAGLKPPPAARPLVAAAASQPKVAARQSAGPDDLKRIVGVGPKTEEALNALGVTRFAQVAAWTPADVADMAQRLGRLGARVESEDWVGQARALEEAGHG